MLYFTVVLASPRAFTSAKPALGVQVVQGLHGGRIGNTTPFLFSADETADVGLDAATPVTEDYAEGDNAFTGMIEKVTVDLR